MGDPIKEIGNQEDQRHIAKAIESLPEYFRNHIAIVSYPSYRILYLNPAAKRMLGLEAEEALIDTAWNTFLPTESRVEIEMAFCNLMPGGDWRGEICIQPFQGETFPAMALVNVSNFDDTEEKILTIICRDLTASKAAEEERKQIELQLNLARKMETVGRLTASIAHEFNTPMQCLLYDLEFMQSSTEQMATTLYSFWGKELPDKEKTSDENASVNTIQALEELVEDTRETFEQSRQNVENVTKIVAALKTFALSDKKGKTAGDINSMVEAIILICRQDWIQKIDLKTDLQTDLPQVDCHIDQINQVILNLLVNAIRSVVKRSEEDSDAEAMIQIRTRSTDSHVVIEIADTGVGIADDQHELIFQASFSSRKNGLGAGQGLALCRTIVEGNHYGKLSFSSELGEGATFRVDLPTN